MLVLSRKRDQSIQIGQDITVLVTAIVQREGCQPVVRLGIDAPRHVSIRRSELEVLDAERSGSEPRECADGGREERAGDLPCVKAVTGCTTDAHECRCGRAEVLTATCGCSARP